MSELISGKEALKALADGEEVEYWCKNDPSIQKRWTPIKRLDEYKLSYFLEDKPRFEFRLKPRTVKIEIEVPATFEPKVGEVFYLLSPTSVGGYCEAHITDQKRIDDYVKFGAWRTEAEIKIVVEQLRKLGALK